MTIALGKKEIYLKMVSEDEKYKPSYAHNTDYCMDLKVKVNITDIKSYEYDGAFYNETETSTWIFPGESKVFGTGLKIAIPDDFGMFVIPRSSTGFNLNCMLANTIGMIDSGFRDEVKVKLYNFGKDPIEIGDGQRVCQFFILPKYSIIANYVEDDKQFRYGDRGGGIGSTGV